jgi:trk system potassium uptake protein
LARNNQLPRHGRVAVLGLGRFGTSLAMELVRRGTEVLALDADARLVQR